MLSAGQRLNCEFRDNCLEPRRRDAQASLAWMMQWHSAVRSVSQHQLPVSHPRSVVNLSRSFDYVQPIGATQNQTGSDLRNCVQMNCWARKGSGLILDSEFLFLAFRGGLTRGKSLPFDVSDLLIQYGHASEGYDARKVTVRFLPLWMCRPSTTVGRDRSEAHPSRHRRHIFRHLSSRLQA
jgi:hypothetical protein